MKAIRIHQFGGPEVLQMDDVPIPTPGLDEILIRVVAASLNPVDYKIRRGGYARVTAQDLPVTLGRDLAGVVETPGGPFSKGDEVFAYLDGSKGGYAQYAVAALTGLAPKPTSLSMTAAAGVPLAATTAWQGLFEYGALKARQRVLIHGGSGGVGAYAVQFAHAAGAQVFSTASGDGLAAARAYGADTVIDYRTARFEDVASDLDLVLDLVGGDTQTRSFSVLKSGGALISAVQPPDADLAASKNVRIERYLARPDAGLLREFAARIDAGTLKTSLSKVFPFAAAAEAHRYLEKEHPRGKVVLAMD